MEQITLPLLRKLELTEQGKNVNTFVECNVAHLTCQMLFQVKRTNLVVYLLQKAYTIPTHLKVSISNCPYV